MICPANRSPSPDRFSSISSSHITLYTIVTIQTSCTAASPDRNITSSSRLHKQELACVTAKVCQKYQLSKIGPWPGLEDESFV